MEKDTITELVVRLEQIEKGVSEIRKHIRRYMESNAELKERVALLEQRVEILERQRNRWVGFISGVLSGAISSAIAFFIKSRVGN